jgi:signal peptidase II
MLIRRTSPLCLISLIALVTIFADQLSKWWIIERVFKPGPTIEFFQWLVVSGGRDTFAPISVLPFFNLVMVWNKGISFGMFQQQDQMMPYILSVLGLCVAGGFLIWSRNTKSLLMQIATGFIVGGALGNIWDRLRFGAVADFFDVYAGTYHWPAFNIADCAITVGVVCLLFHLLLDNQPDAVSPPSSS